MYVMNKKWDSITNIAQCTSVYVSPEHEIKAVPTGGGNVYRLGQYETAEIARAVLNDLYMHIPTGCIYQMPNDQRALVLARGMSDERPEKFAGNGKKPVRRGGSWWQRNIIVVEKTGRRGYAILMLAPIVCTSERATAGATKSEKSFFLTGSLQSITWGAARKEKKSDRIRDFQNYFEVASDYGSELCNWGAHCV